MLLAIDAGNTNVVFAVYDGTALHHAWRCRTESGRTADEYAAWLYQLFCKENMGFAQVTDVVVASVVPHANMHLRHFCVSSFDCEPLFVGAETVNVRIGLDKPSEIGADRLVNACAVLHDGLAPAVVIDFGTATTFDVIDADDIYRGGVIAPGVHLSMEALHRAAAKLPKVDIAKTVHVIGTDTVSAMQSGVYWGYVAMIEGTLARITAELGYKPCVIATGGLASLFADTIPAIDKVDKDLTLRGLFHIYHSNQAKKAA